MSARVALSSILNVVAFASRSFSALFANFFGHCPP